MVKVARNSRKPVLLRRVMEQVIPIEVRSNGRQHAVTNIKKKRTRLRLRMKRNWMIHHDEQLLLQGSKEILKELGKSET